MPANGGFATVGDVRTRRRPVATGAIALSVVLLGATACSSASDDATGESLPAAPAETTVGAPEPTDATTPITDAPAPAPAATGGDTSTTEPATTEAAVVVPEALQFTAPLVGGGTFDGAAVAGKPTVFWFWAPT